MACARRDCRKNKEHLRCDVEACGSAHYWGREVGKLGHTVKLMPPKYVKAYVKRGKTDAGDAAAICEAVTRPSMSFVPVKGVEQQGLSMLHNARSQPIGQRTQFINAVRGHLSEFGIVAERGLLGLVELAAIVRDESDQRLLVTARAALMVLVRWIETLITQIAALDSTLRKENKASELGPRLETIPSVGPVIASALRARVTDAELFENGRHLSAWIGIVPENDSTGDKVKQKGLSKKGDRYLRSPLVNGAMAVVRQAQFKPGRSSGRENLLWVTGVEPTSLIRTHLANHIRASSHESDRGLYCHELIVRERHLRRAQPDPHPTKVVASCREFGLSERARSMRLTPASKSSTTRARANPADASVSASSLPNWTARSMSRLVSSIS